MRNANEVSLGDAIKQMLKTYKIEGGLDSINSITPFLIHVSAFVTKKLSFIFKVSSFESPLLVYLGLKL